MCFYARKDFSCGDFKWGNMKQRCPRERRIGEHCDAKLLDADYLETTDETCRICQDIETKKRRLRKEQDNIGRWQNDRKTNFQASIEKAQRESRNLEEQIRELNSRRPYIKISPKDRGVPRSSGYDPRDHARPAQPNPMVSRHSASVKEVREDRQDYDRHGSDYHGSLAYRTSSSQVGYGQGGGRHAP